MAEVVKFDIMGYRRLEFDDDGVTHYSKELYPVPLPGFVAIPQVVTNRAIPFADVRWVGKIRKRQWWALGVGIVGTLLGLFWMAANWGDWGPFGVSVGFLLLIGLFPLSMFARGRVFLAVASNDEMISLPMDRKRRQVRMAIDLLRKYCDHDEVNWNLN